MSSRFPGRPTSLHMERTIRSPWQAYKYPTLCICVYVTGGLMRRLPWLLSFHTKSQVLEIHRHENHFKVSHNKKSYKVDVLERIYFSIIG
jgi:hypothetical protein